MCPILIGLADRGLLETEWEKDPQPGRPAGHLYRLTADGVRFADELAVADASKTTVTLRPRTAAASQASATVRPRTAGGHRTRSHHDPQNDVL